MRVRCGSGLPALTSPSTGKFHAFFSAGDSFVIKPGFKGTWEVLETTRKEYVIRL